MNGGPLLGDQLVPLTVVGGVLLNGSRTGMMNSNHHELEAVSPPVLSVGVGVGIAVSTVTKG